MVYEHERSNQLEARLALVEGKANTLETRTKRTEDISALAILVFTRKEFDTAKEALDYFDTDIVNLSDENRRFFGVEGE